MQLIGMLDSPYVRRTAITLRCLGLPFEHRAVSVISTFAEFQAINPVVKAPTLVCDNGDVLMDSGLIIDYAEALAGRSLLPEAFPERQRALKQLGLALAACEKGVQRVYELKLRPEDKQHEPWLTRVQGQMLAACAGLEQSLVGLPVPGSMAILDQVSLTSAVVWGFLRTMASEVVLEADYPAWAALSAAAEQLPVFLEFPPVGPGVKAP